MATSKSNIPLSFGMAFEEVADATVCDWAEASIVLPPKIATPFPGPYRRAITPYVEGILESLRDVRIHTAVVAKGAQTGLTQAAYIAMGYWVVNDPGPILLVYPNEDLARSTSETRVMPMFEFSPVLAAELPKNRRDDWTKLQYKLNRCAVNWVGSNSPAALASRPVRYLILDEVDKYPPNTGREADPVNLAMQRTKTFWNRKTLMISTPTADTGPIWRHFERGDQRRYFVPCHKCGAMQYLKWAQVKFDSKAQSVKAAAESFYECEECKVPWSDLDKVGAVSRGEWRATAVAESSGVASFHLSSLYAPWVTWAGLVEKFMKTQVHTSELRDFVNSDLGEPFKAYEIQIRNSMFIHLEGAYEEGEKSGGPDGVIIAGCDVQKGYLVAVFREWFPGGASRLIWAGTVNSLDRLEELAAGHDARYVMIDQRYRQREIQEFAYGHAGYIPCYGMATRARSMFSVNALDLDEGRSKRTGDRVIEILAHDPDSVKDELSNLIRRIDGAPDWKIPRGYSANADYCAQMTAEQSVNGRWVNTSQRANHFWDAECLSLLGAIRFGIWNAEPVESESGEQTEAGNASDSNAD